MIGKATDMQSLGKAAVAFPNVRVPRSRHSQDNFPLDWGLCTPYEAERAIKENPGLDWGTWSSSISLPSAVAEIIARASAG